MVRKLWAGRRAVAVIAAVAVSIPTIAAAGPGSGIVGPLQEGPSDEGGSDDALVAIDVDVADGDAEAISGALDEIQANVAKELKQLSAAEAVVMTRIKKLAEIEQSIYSLEGKIESLTNASDSVVVTTFMNPPYESAVESMTSESLEDSTVKQAILEMRADEDAAKLEKLTSARAKLRKEKQRQIKAKADAQRARQDSEAAVADLKAAFGQHTEFVTQVQKWVNDPEGATAQAGLSQSQIRHLQDVKSQLAGKVKQLQAAEAVRRAAQELADAQERLRIGGFGCPLKGTIRYRDTWGAPRPGGRTHKGTDMMQPTGEPIVAPVSGRVVHYSNSTAGTAFYLYGDDGHKYMGAHLSKRISGERWVKAGETIGLVGSTGDASVPHLHFQYHPNGGDPVNPYTRLTQVCPRTPV